MHGNMIRTEGPGATKLSDPSSVGPTPDDGGAAKGTFNDGMDNIGVCVADPAAVQIGPVTTTSVVAQLPTHLNPAATSRASDPGISQLPLAVLRGAQPTASRLVPNISVSTSGQVPVPLADTQGLTVAFFSPKLLRSGSSGLTSFHDSRPNLQGGNPSGRGTMPLAAAAAARPAATSPSFRRQLSGGGGGSFRRQPNGGAVAVVHSVAFSDPGSTSSGGGHVLMPYGEGSNSLGSRSHSGHDRGGGGLRGDAGDVGRRRSWLRGLFCFGGRSPERLVGYRGQDDLAVVAMQRREALQVAKSTSRRLSKAVSDTFMVRSSRPAPTVVGAAASSGAANTCPGSPGTGRGSRKLQPMLSLQPHKSILKSSSLNRKVGDAEPILVKVASARAVSKVPELSNTAVTTAADVDGDGNDGVEVGIATSAASPGVVPAEDGPRESQVCTVSAASARLNTAGPLEASIKGGCDVDDPMEGTAVANCGVLIDSPLTAGEEAAAAIATGDNPPSQTRTMPELGNLPSSGPISPVAARGQLNPSISIVTKGIGANPSAVGWFPESPSKASGAASPPATNGGRVLLKTMSLQHTIQARLAGIIGTNVSSTVDAAASGALSSVASGGSGPVEGISASGAPITGTDGGHYSTGGGSGGGSGDEVRPSLAQRMMTRQASRGHGSGLGGSSSPSSAVGGGNSPLGRVMPRNAVLPLPSLMVSTGGTGTADLNMVEGSSPLSTTPRRVASLRRPVAAEPALPGGTQVQTPSYPSSPSHYYSQIQRRLPGKSSKLAAGLSGQGNLSEEDRVENPFYDKSERVTAPARQVRDLVGTLAKRSEISLPATAGEQRRVTTGGLDVDFDDDNGDGQAVAAAVAVPSHHQLQVTRSMKDRMDRSHLPSESPQLAQPAAASLHASDVVTPHRALEGCGVSATVGVPPGQVEDLAPLQAASNSTAGAGRRKRSLAAVAANRGYTAPNTAISSSSTSLEDYMTGIAASLRATIDPASSVGGMDDSDEDDEGVNAPARWRMGIDGERTSGEWQDLDTWQARRMVAEELLRMRTLGIEPGVQANHLEAEVGQRLEPGALRPPDQLLERQQKLPVLSEQNRKGAAVSETPLAAADSLGPLATTGGDEASSVARASGRDTQEASAAAPSPATRFRLTKFHSLGHGAFRSSYGAPDPLAQLQQQEPSGVPLTASMLRASAEAALDNVRRVSGTGGAAGLIAAAASIVAGANATPDGKSAAEGATTSGGVKDPWNGSTHMFAATPRDSLESWVRNHSRRCAADRAGGLPLGGLHPLDELTEVTGFGTAAMATVASPPPMAPVGEPTPAAMPFSWATGSQSLHRGIRLGPEPEVLQTWLHRNDRPRVQRETAVQQDQRGGGTGTGATVPVMRQSLPGNVRLGAKV